ncbi:MAG TPA: DUF3822 family protein [Pedobacter sp.]|nr:DUF3822 family protein [Pedobacter sp.]
MNSKNSILLVDPEFDPNTAADCSLLIKITADSLSYAIVDKSCNQLKAVYDQQECRNAGRELANRLKNDSYLNLPFKEIKASVFTENSIAVPDELFDPQDLNKYARYFVEAQSSNLYLQPVGRFGFTTIFNISTAIEESLDTLNSCKRYDHSAALLSVGRERETTSLNLDFTVGSVNVSYINNEQLIFQKYYQIENSEEFNYYLLLIISQLKINLAKTTLYLSGIIHQNDSNHQCITKYFNTVHFAPAVENNMDSRILDDMPAHYYSSLLALDQCE